MWNFSMSLMEKECFRNTFVVEKSLRINDSAFQVKWVNLGKQQSLAEHIDDVSSKLSWSKEPLFQNRDCFHWAVADWCLLFFLCRLADELHMPSLPEMMFGDNVLRIQHDHGFGIEFNATDALKCVNNCQGMIKVACAEEWQESRYSILSPVASTGVLYMKLSYSS